MDQGQFIEELFALSETTRRLARQIADPAIRSRLADLADEVVALAVREIALLSGVRP
jgi:hypothetical protein